MATEPEHYENEYEAPAIESRVEVEAPMNLVATSTP